MIWNVTISESYNVWNHWKILNVWNDYTGVSPVMKSHNQMIWFFMIKIWLKWNLLIKNRHQLDLT